MPSPIAHLGVGYAIYRHYKDKLPQDSHNIWKLPLQLILVTGLSMLPDLDVIPAIVLRDMQAYHNNISHSLFIGIPVAFIVAGVFHRAYRSNFWLWFVICLISYDLHVIMDVFTAERGVMMLYPFTEERYASSVKLFYGLQWGLGLFSPCHLWTIFTESVFVGIVLTAMSYFDKRRKTVMENLK